MANRPERIVQDCLQAKANELVETAEALPHGGEKDALIDRARGLKDASRVIDRWALSPGLRAPR